MEDGIILERGVETGVVAERAFGSCFAGLDGAFEDEIDVGWDLEVDGFALHQLD
jgi:hypothetical protein